MLEFSIAAESICAFTTLLAVALGLSVLLCVRFVGPLLRKRFELGHRLELFCQALFAGLTSLQLFAWHLYSYRDSHDAFEVRYVIGALVVGMCLWQLNVAGPNSRHPRLAPYLPTALGCLALLQLAGFAAVTKCFANFEPNSSVPVLDPPGELVIHDRASAKTDGGTKLVLYQRTASQEEFDVFLNRTRANMNSVAQRALLRGEPRLNSNCHGWVFTGGMYIVQSRDVQTILDENCYVEVDTPVLNDVVVYRDEAGQIIHTGVVRGFLDDDSVLVESKWGVEGTYLHLATEQPYSPIISYWHTGRGTHQLSTVPAERSPSAGAR